MRVAQAGLRLTGDQVGQLLGWARVTDGRWVGLVRMEVAVAAGRGVLPMMQWVPAAAVRPDDHNTTGMSGRGPSGARPS